MHRNPIARLALACVALLFTVSFAALAAGTEAALVTGTGVVPNIEQPNSKISPRPNNCHKIKRASAFR